MRRSRYEVVTIEGDGICRRFFLRGASYTDLLSLLEA